MTQLIIWIKPTSRGYCLQLTIAERLTLSQRNFINWTFKRFGFGESFCKWLKVLTVNTESRINYMGWLSEPIKVESGIQQGCPFSPLAFIPFSHFILHCHVQVSRSINKFKNNNKKARGYYVALLVWFLRVSLWGGDGDSSVVRAPDSWLKAPGFKSL